MISINEIIFSNYMIGDGPIRDVTNHPPDIRHPDNKIRTLYSGVSSDTGFPIKEARFSKLKNISHLLSEDKEGKIN